MRIRLCVVLASSALIAACAGDTGPQGTTGPAGPEGPQGDHGPPGPIAAPPTLAALSPGWGSANTEVTITGASFSTTAADNHVYFDGYAATVVSASATQLVVNPGASTDDGELPMVVTVEVANQVSNALPFTLVPSGSARAMDVAMPTSPTSVVAVGASLYIAAGAGGGRTPGLYQMDAAGSVSRVWTPSRINASDGQGGTFTLFDAPVAVASDGTDVYFVSMFGAVRRLVVATGTVIEVLAPALGSGDFFPGRTGIAIAGGVLYVVDRNLDQGGGNFGGIVALDTTDVTVFTIADILFDGSGNSGIFGIATDGTDLWVTNEAFGEIHRINNPAGSFTVDMVADGGSGLQGIALIDDDATAGVETVVASGSDGDLMAANMTATGASLAAFNDTESYLYRASGLAVDGDGDLLLAQPDGSCVRELASGGVTSTIVAAGLRPGFATVRDGTTTYLASVGPALFSGGLSLTQPDGAVIAIGDAGTTRVVANTSLPAGIVVSAAGQLTVSDCVERRIFTLDTTTGVQADRLDDADGLSCPTGLALGTRGDLFFVDMILGDNSTPSTIGRLTSTGVLTASFATGLSPSTIFLARAGDFLLSAPLGDSSGGQSFPIERSSATATGAATTLVAGPAIGSAGLAVGPEGRAFALRSQGLGEILELDPATGALTRFGSALVPGSTLGPGGGGSIAFCASFLPDGTLIIPDFGQGTIIAVAP